MPSDSGKLKIGDDWNAIRIIALSQNNPLKAIAEFVENSIDAGAKNVGIVRGKQDGEQYLKIVDDGHGIDDFRYLATHIGDSLKRKLKKQGATGIQGEFGIGLLSFWTVGEECVLVSQGKAGQAHSLRLSKGNPTFAIRALSSLLPQAGTELVIKPLLPGVRMLSGEKIQNYLASELRDRIAKSGVRIRISDRTARKELVVEPRKYRGRLLHDLRPGPAPQGEVYVELYLADPAASAGVSLCKQGTRIMPDIRSLDEFARPPWNSSLLEGLIDAPFLQLTPGTRDGIVLDDAYESLVFSLEAIEPTLAAAIEEQRKAEEEEASKAVFHKLSKAFREAFLLLPQEEYGWLGIKAKAESRNSAQGQGSARGGVDGLSAGDGKTQSSSENAVAEGGLVSAEMMGQAMAAAAETNESQLRFFEHAGSLFSVLISPSSSVIAIGGEKRLRAAARDRSRRIIDSGIGYKWIIEEGIGSIEGSDSEFAVFRAGQEPGISRIKVWATESDEVKSAEAVVTVAAHLAPKAEGMGASKKGLPGYTFQRAPGELWRSRYDAERELIVVNSAHADFIFASRGGAASKLRYIMRLYAKELVLTNFPEADRTELLERMVELGLYAESGL
jgi:hypothetical protein